MKKIIATFGLFLLLSVSAFAYRCYEFWLEDYEDATREYESDSNYCRSLMEGYRMYSMCMQEANLKYSQAINQSGEIYYRCVYNS
jgi:hypothetical protein